MIQLVMTNLHFERGHIRDANGRSVCAFSDAFLNDPARITHAKVFAAAPETLTAMRQIFEKLQAGGPAAIAECVKIAYEATERTHYLSKADYEANRPAATEAS